MAGLRRVLVLGALLALGTGSAVAQQQADGPAFDAALLERCLSGTERGDGPVDARETCIGAAADPCMDSQGGSTTVGMSACLGNELDLWDARLNETYREVMAQSEATDGNMAELGSAAEKESPLLRDMQRNWIAFRDTACGFERSRWGGGTGGGPAGLHCALTLTARQYLWLDQYRGKDM
ncbi:MULTISPECIES: lysozyme inhibitor LprI family protein [Paracoccus]|jgi:uncharacterized protein YecT (DUF1311 family)|uniref:lysozyme inhibitor LprI family protein n=1 Tax=Paracoccus TaxID=265 RepID=UPI001E538E7B|nr:MULTISPECIES: lysozyme inhibitor LprI family protein [Paracoccus]UFS67637.1 DUF1311 domain-containing protein [Paracoccus denitrificans]